MQYPVDSYLSHIHDALFSSPSRTLVLQAETGAGKSTRVPQSFVPRVPGKILMLEPRRLAATAIANRIAELLGEACGKTCGYRIHLETRVSPDTRIEIITEAILVRMMQSDPELSGVSLVILDEFHERSLHGDLALALLRDIMDLRDDLYLVIMSATLDTNALETALAAQTISVPGRVYPVDIEYRPQPPSQTRISRFSLEEHCAQVISHEADLLETGSMLVFLPGIAEIRRVERLLSVQAEVCVLHSSIPFEDQRKVLSGGGRRVILSSSIAETSLTVPDVHVVIDSGLSRTSRYDAGSGIPYLETTTESEFSSRQRAGRAGRTGPGRCIRLWAAHDSRLARSPCEMLRSDLAELVLECALWGVTEPAGLRWLDAPPDAHWRSAREFLVLMGACTPSASVTDFGRAMAALPVHPRIAAVALAGGIDEAVRLAAGEEENYEARKLRELLEKAARTHGGKQYPRTNGCAVPLLAGFPDRLAKHEADDRYRLPSGKLARLSASLREDRNVFDEWIIATDVDATGGEPLVRSASPVTESVAEKWVSAHGTERSSVICEGRVLDGAARFEKKTGLWYGDIPVRVRSDRAEGPEVAAALCAMVRKSGLDILPWTEESRQCLLRASFCRHRGMDVPSTAEEDLIQSLESWLLPFVNTARPKTGAEALSSQALLDALRYRFDGSLLDRQAPSAITLENGLKRALVYEVKDERDGPVPVLEVRVQDLYGTARHPRAGGVSVLLILLSPARRPIQITRDLAGFWKTSWAEVRKEMRGRYPKHKWPEDPARNE